MWLFRRSIKDDHKKPVTTHSAIFYFKSGHGSLIAVERSADQRPAEGWSVCVGVLGSRISILMSLPTSDETCRDQSSDRLPRSLFPFRA